MKGGWLTRLTWSFLVRIDGTGVDSTYSEVNVFRLEVFVFPEKEKKTGHIRRVLSMMMMGSSYTYIQVGRYVGYRDFSVYGFDTTMMALTVVEYS